MVTARNSLDLYASQRFLKAYGRASLGLQDNAEGAIHDLVRRFRSNPRTFMQGYQRVRGCRAPILEIDISGSHRLLAHYANNRAIMLDVGDHDIVRLYSDSKYESDREDIEKAPSQFFPDRPFKFFKSYLDTSIAIKYAQEVSSGWLYFLENTQEEVYEDIVERVLADKVRYHPSFIIGGPGTGKTCILLNLLKYFADSEYRVGIVLSDNLCEYVEASTRADISKYRVSLDDMSPLDLLLIDDPKHDDLTKAICLAGTDTVGAVVMAFDPLQLDVAISDGEYRQMVIDNRVKTYKLNECYRQKKNVGEHTKHIVDMIAASTAFLDEVKIEVFRQEHRKLTKLANNLVFLNPHGYTKAYDNANVNDIRSEVKRILDARGLMWQHWPGLLILLDNCNLTEAGRRVIRLIPPKYVKEFTLRKVEEVKGLEFQHVFIFIRKDCYEELQTGFKGTGQNVYNQRRLLRIPFSRAKDSVVVFAIEVEE
jgi:hypothetical protein